jgi:hypothetical protein
MAADPLDGDREIGKVGMPRVRDEPFLKEVIPDEKEAYVSTADVEALDVVGVLSLLTLGCVIAIDVAKTKLVAALGNGDGGGAEAAAV